MGISTRSYLFLLLWFGFIVLGAQLTPYFANDFRYMLIMGTQDHVSSLSDIFISQYRHYFEWGGRTVAHVIAQFLLFIGKPAAAVIQAVTYLLLILFIYFNAYGVRPTLKVHLPPLAVITVLLFLQLRAYGEVVFNVVSSANYLYTIVLVLMFLLPYRISMRQELNTPLWLLWPMMFVLGVLAGWSNEATAAAVATGLGLYLLFNFKRQKLRLWQCIGYVGFLLGFALLIFAPGNRARMDSMEDKGFNYVVHLWDSIQIFGETLLACALLLIVVGYLLYRIHAHCVQFKEPILYYGGLWFLGMGVFSLVLMVFSPNFPVRASTTFVVFTCVAIPSFARLVKIHYQRLLPPIFERIAMVIFGAFTVAVMLNAIWAYLVIHSNIQVRNAEILAQHEQGLDSFEVKPLVLRTYKYLYVADVRHDPNYWTNKIVANFQDIKQISRTQDFKPEAWHYDFKFFTSRQTIEDLLPVTEKVKSQEVSESKPSS